MKLRVARKTFQVIEDDDIVWTCRGLMPLL